MMVRERYQLKFQPELQLSRETLDLFSDININVGDTNSIINQSASITSSYYPVVLE